MLLKTARDREVVKRQLMDYYLGVGLQSDDDLDHFLKEYVGLTIPRKHYCADHCAPFDFVSDLFFERESTVLGFGSRGSGKTLDVAAVNFLHMRFKEGCDICTAGASLDQARKGYNYLQQMCLRPEHKDWLDGDPTLGLTRGKNKTQIEIITGTVKGLNSPHPLKANIDEVELLDWEVLQQGLSMSMSKPEYPWKSADVFTCVAGDTLIDVPRDLSAHPDGIPIRDLVGKTGWVYSFNKRSGKVTLKRFTHVRKTGVNAEVYRVRFRWSEYGGKKRTGFLDVTGNHRFMLRDGSYRSADKLQPDDSLMPFSRTREFGPNGLPYAKICRNDGSSIPEHILVCGKVHGTWADKHNVVHHRSFNSLDNRPEMLVRWPRAKHAHYHANLPRNTEYLQENGRKVGALHAAWVESLPPAQYDAWIEKQRRDTTAMIAARGGAWNRGRKRPAEERRRVSQSLTRTAAKRIGITRDEIDQQVLLASKKVVGSHYAIAEYLHWSPTRVYSSLRRLGLTNHKVTSVRRLKKRVDVYDMEVEGTHNFVANGVFVHNSTRKYGAGTMQRLLDEAPDRGIKIYKWCVWEALERCTRDCVGDKQNGDCPLYTDRITGAPGSGVCGGKAHTANGWYRIEDFIRKVQLLDKETFEAEWENLRPSSGHLVYGSSFNEATHVVDPFEIPNIWPTFAAIDFGAHFSYLKFAIDPSTKVWFCFYCYYFEKPRLLKDHRTNIRSSPRFRSTEAIYAGIRGIDKQPFIEFQQHFPMVEAEQDLLVGINDVKTKLQDRKRFVFPNGKEAEIPGLVFFRGAGDMAMLIKEAGQYGWETNPDGTANLEEPVEDNNHCWSAVRYAVLTRHKKALGYRTRKARGV